MVTEEINTESRTYCCFYAIILRRQSKSGFPVSYRPVIEHEEENKTDDRPCTSFHTLAQYVTRLRQGAVRLPLQVQNKNSEWPKANGASQHVLNQSACPFRNETISYSPTGLKAAKGTKRSK